MKVATPLEEVATLLNDNVPRIVYLITSNQFFIVAEQDVLCELNDISEAIFTWFAVHYVFNIKYAKKVVNVGYFFQDNIFELTDDTVRSSTYNSIVGDIKQYM